MGDVPPLLLRIMDRSRWSTDDCAWLSLGEVPATAAYDLRATKNTLSFFAVSPGKADAVRVALAAASTRQKLEPVDFKVVQAAQLVEAGIQVEQSLGGTLDAWANGRHVDAVHLTMSALTQVARILQECEWEPTLQKNAMERLVYRAVEEGELNAIILEKWKLTKRS